MRQSPCQVPLTKSEAHITLAGEQCLGFVVCAMFLDHFGIHCNHSPPSPNFPFLLHSAIPLARHLLLGPIAVNTSKLALCLKIMGERRVGGYRRYRHIMMWGMWVETRSHRRLASTASLPNRDERIDPGLLGVSQIISHRRGSDYHLVVGLGAIKVGRNNKVL